MSTPEQPATPPLTRKQIREIRNTGASPIITADGVVATPVDEQTPSSYPTEQPVDEAVAVVEPPAASAPLPRAASPVAIAPRPVADSSVDLGVNPLTRRQARQQERIRTASVPVITPEAAAQHAPQPVAAPAAAGSAGVGLQSLFVAPAPGVEQPSFNDSDFAPLVLDEDVTAQNEGWRDMVVQVSPETSELAASLVASEQAAPLVAETSVDANENTDHEVEDEPVRAVVNPLLGAELLTSKPGQSDVPASFDQIFARSTGAVSTSKALIMANTPTVADFGGAVTATGEIIVTGTFQLPEGLGSTGHALGTTDGKEADAVLIDGELPAHSSPTPIAASAAISTVKSAGDVIRPPAPEKGSRLMMSLAITAGVLALALVGVLIVAFATGVFS
ncbi:hypothetical protein ACWPKO_20640 (plasmid) [Coraliomargarita sp. W4R53]